MTNPQHEALVEAKKATFDAISLHYESDLDYEAFRNALNKAYDAGVSAALSAIAATPSDEEVCLREALERLVAATNLRALRGRDHVPSMREEQDARAFARAALEPQGKDV